MATGDPQCPLCGLYFPLCGYPFDGRCISDDMSMRPKPTLEGLRQDWETRAYGRSLDPVTLREYLAGYMGDEFFAEKFAECIDLIKVKNADYSQGEQKGDRIAAFRRIARDINITMEQAWAVFCQKHWGAVMKYVKDGAVESEPIDGRITDIINYMVLLSAIIADGRKETTEGEG